MRRMPSGQLVNTNRPPIVPNAVPVVPGAPHDLGETARLKSVEDRLVPKNTKKIDETIAEFKDIKKSDYIYISDDNANLRKLLANKISGVQGLAYAGIVELYPEDLGVEADREYTAEELKAELDPTGKEFDIDPLYFNRPPLKDETVLVYLSIKGDDTAVWLTVSEVIKFILTNGTEVDEYDDFDDVASVRIYVTYESINLTIAQFNEEEMAAIRSGINSELVAQITKNKNAINTEKNRAINKENALDDKVDTETANRVAAITNEATTRANKDTELDTKITIEKNNRVSAVNAEKERAQQEEQALNTKIENRPTKAEILALFD